jgi:hypothetical protein
VVKLYEDEKILIVKSKIEHCHFLAKDLRDEDKKELFNCGHKDFFKIILDSYGLSKDECYTLYYHDKISMMFGVKKEDDMGRIWMLSTDAAKEFPLTFLKLAKKYIKQLADKYGVVYNYIHVDNKQSMKLLTYCGAEFFEGYTSQKTKLPFLMFRIIGVKNV